MRRWWAVISMVVVAGVVSLMGAPIAGAQTLDCDTVVVDGAGVLRDPTTLTQNATFMGYISGTRVRVRTVAALDGREVEAYERGLEAACPSWQREDGGRAADLVVVLVAPNDRQTGIYYGTDAQARLDPVYQSVQADAMNPRFKSGDFDGGIRAGIVGLQEALVPPVGPPAVVRDRPSGAAGAASTPTGVRSGSSSDVLAVAALVGLGLLAVGVVVAAVLVPRPSGRPSGSRRWGGGGPGGGGGWFGGGGGFGGGGFGGGGFGGGGFGGGGGGGAGGGFSGGGGGGGGDGGGGSSSW